MAAVFVGEDFPTALVDALQRHSHDSLSRKYDWDQPIVVHVVLEMRFVMGT